MAEYFNARELLPGDLILEVLAHLPEESRNGAVLYFSEDYYARRNAEIAGYFRIYQSDPEFESHAEIYEALSEQYGLTIRQICRIVTAAGVRGGARRCDRRRRSGIRVGRVSRRMRVKTEVS